LLSGDRLAERDDAGRLPDDDLAGRIGDKWRGPMIVIDQVERVDHGTGAAVDDRVPRAAGHGLQFNEPPQPDFAWADRLVHQRCGDGSCGHAAVAQQGFLPGAPAGLNDRKRLRGRQVRVLRRRGRRVRRAAGRARAADRQGQVTDEAGTQAQDAAVCGHVDVGHRPVHGNTTVLLLHIHVRYTAVGAQQLAGDRDVAEVGLREAERLQLGAKGRERNLARRAGSWSCELADGGAERRGRLLIPADFFARLAGRLNLSLSILRLSERWHAHGDTHRREHMQSPALELHTHPPWECSVGSLAHGNR
jgi:hypothetical protein